MCRFALYLGPEITLEALVTRPGHSIVVQSYHAVERREPLNGDGFGIAWYVPDLSDEPALFKSVSPAWSNRNLNNLARVTRSSCILAHVRAATPGLPVTRQNCHPFSHHRFAFMHNGEIGGFHQIKRNLQEGLSNEAFSAILGSTDSEHLFAYAMDSLDQESQPADCMAAALTEAIRLVERERIAASIESPSLLNLVLTDGSSAAVTRFISEGFDLEPASLYTHTGRQYVCEDGDCRMVEPDHESGTVLIASEPLSGDPGWDPVSRNHVVTVYPDRTIALRPIEIG